MYSGLSNIYKEKMKLPAQIRRLTGTLDGQPITGKNIITNSAKILRQCSEKNEVQIGQVYIGQLNLTFTNITIPWRQLKGKEVVLYEGLWIDRTDELEESYWDDVELGHFFISDAQSSTVGFECVCYDAMYRFDEKMDINNPTGTSDTLYQLISLACNQCGVTLGMTETEINNMPNGSETLLVYGEDNDMETYQDLISWCAQTMGANALINRSGQLVFKNYDGVNSVVETFTAKDRIGGSGKCSSFETFFTGISMVNIEESTTSYYSMITDNGSVMNLGSNPLLQPQEEESEEQLARKRMRILFAISDINYTPFDNIRLNRPCVYDLMDVIELTGGILGSSVDIYGCITKYEWTLLGGVKIQGAGANPALVSAKSKTDKNIVGLKKSDDKNKNDVKDIQQEIVDLGNKQNYIDMDLLEPTGSGSEGDLMFWAAQGDSFKRFYRYEDNEWVRLTFEKSGTQEPDNSDGVEGDVMFQNDGSNIINIWQRVDSVWMDLLVAGRHIYATEEHKVGEWINENDVYEKTYKLENLPSNSSLTFPHGIGGFGLILYTRGMRNTNNVFTDLLCDNKISVDGINITLTSNVAQSGNAYLTIGYTKPYGGYYTTNRFYKYNTGLVVTGWYMEGIKTASGDCYSGMVVGRAVNINSLCWAAFCISLEESVAMAMTYHNGSPSQSHTLEYNGQTWYYTYEATRSAATSTDLDGTDPASRRYYIGDYTAHGSTFEELNTEFIELAISMLMDYIYT